MKNQVKSLLILVSLIGLVLLASAFVNFPDLTQTRSLTILLALIASAVIAQFIVVSDSNRFFDVGTAIALSGGALFGPNVCVIIIAISLVTLSIKQLLTKSFTPRQIVEQLGFNMGMLGLAGYIASSLYLILIERVPQWWWFGPCWLITSFTFMLVNAFFMSTMLRVQHDMPLRQYWRTSRWTHLIDFVIHGIGAGLFTMAILLTGALGVVIFSFPLLLSFFAFRLQVRESNKQKQLLEAIIAERTQELSLSNQQLTNVLLQKNRFISILSHDMKTPLTAILLYAQMLRDVPVLTNPKRLKIAETIVTSGNALKDLVLNIIDVEAMETDAEPKLIKTTVNVVEIVEAALKTIEPQATHSKITLRLDKPLNELFVDGDRNKLLRVVTNLLSNAVKYTPKEGRVAVAIDPIGNHVNLQIKDTGYGIPDEQLEVIFTPYHRVEDNNQYAAGTGLGLSVVKYLVEAHEGTILVDSVVGEGSVFTVTLPLSGATRPEVASEPGAEGIQSAEMKHDATPDSAPATQAQPDNRSSSPHLPQNESAAPAQTHRPAPRPATQS